MEKYEEQMTEFLKNLDEEGYVGLVVIGKPDKDEGVTLTVQACAGSKQQLDAMVQVASSYQTKYSEELDNE